MSPNSGEAVIAGGAAVYQQRLAAARTRIADRLESARALIAAARRPMGANVVVPGVPVAPAAPTMFRVDSVGATGLQQLVRDPAGVALPEAVAQSHRDFDAWQQRQRAAGSGGQLA